MKQFALKRSNRGPKVTFGSPSTLGAITGMKKPIASVGELDETIDLIDIPFWKSQTAHCRDIQWKGTRDVTNVQFQERNSDIRIDFNCNT
jgi:hypothetical protein